MNDVFAISLGLYFIVEFSMWGDSLLLTPDDHSALSDRLSELDGSAASF